MKWRLELVNKRVGFTRSFLAVIDDSYKKNDKRHPSSSTRALFSPQATAAMPDALTGLKLQVTRLTATPLPCLQAGVPTTVGWQLLHSAHAKGSSYAANTVQRCTNIDYTMRAHAWLSKRASFLHSSLVPVKRQYLNLFASA